MHVNDLLTEMNRELEHIATSTGNVGDLSEKLDQADALKTEVSKIYFCIYLLFLIHFLEGTYWKSLCIYICRYFGENITLLKK